VNKSASADEIRKAYRSSPKSCILTCAPMTKPRKERFKRATAAFNLLSDAEHKARFDRGRSMPTATKK